VYLIIPGALYHLVATYSVSTGITPSFSLTDTNLASPKSASLALHSEFKSILDGLRSLWINFPVWIYLMDFNI
jgi:hypothetical protein